MASNGQRQISFDAEKVFKLFCSCRDQNNSIFLACYIDAYEELCKLFKLFGSLFSFVVSDVEEKIANLRDYLDGDNSGKYITVQRMLKFEVLNNLLENESKPSGTETLLRLHRAMEFISALIVKLRDTENNEKFSTHASEAYEATLAKHHNWVVKNAVHMAFYFLPTRHDILMKMGVENNEQRVPGMNKLALELNNMSDIINGLYSKYNLLNMP